jgi:hypothetical protein
LLKEHIKRRYNLQEINLKLERGVKDDVSLWLAGGVASLLAVAPVLPVHPPTPFGFGPGTLDEETAFAGPKRN